MQVARAAHRALGFDQGFESEDPDLAAVEVQSLASCKAFGITADAFDITEAIELPPVGRKVKVLQPALLRLPACERQSLRSHAVHGPQAFNRSEEPEQIVRLHPAGDIHIPGHQCAAVHERSQPSGNHKLNSKFSEPLGDACQFFHGISNRLHEEIRLR